MTVLTESEIRQIVAQSADKFGGTVTTKGRGTTLAVLQDENIRQEIDAESLRIRASLEKSSQEGIGRTRVAAKQTLQSTWYRPMDIHSEALGQAFLDEAEAGNKAVDQRMSSNGMETTLETYSPTVGRIGLLAKTVIDERNSISGRIERSHVETRELDALHNEEDATRQALLEQHSRNPVED